MTTKRQNSKPPCLLTDFLTELRVPHTYEYSVDRFGKMPFQTLFGLSKLLKEYGVDSEGYHLDDRSQLEVLTPPFIAATSVGMVIVTEVGDDKISYISQGEPERAEKARFDRAWTGDVLLAYPSDGAEEPDYASHVRMAFLMSAKKWVLLFCAVAIFLYLFIANGLYRHVSTVLLSLFDMAGLYFTWLLVQKSLNIHTRAGDRVCKVLQEGGCDSILSLKASKFFGLFGWSDVGFAYFSVSLLVMLLLPGMLPWLALCNLCCLPFTFWSIWYQKFRAKKWCTLCVCVQATLWALFFCYLSGGWLRMAWPLSTNFFALGVGYLGVMLAINALNSFIAKLRKTT